ncbi:hypothetical protein ACHAW6_007815 [Cyclotella cf. meneghiniana]
MVSKLSTTTMLDARCIDEIIGFIEKREQPSPTSVAAASFNFHDEDKKQDLRKRVNEAAMMFLESILCKTLTITEYNYRMTVLNTHVEAALRYFLLNDVPAKIQEENPESELDMDDEEYCDKGEDDDDDEDWKEKDEDKDEGEDEDDDEELIDEAMVGQDGDSAKKEFDSIFPPVKGRTMSDKVFLKEVLGPIIEERFRLSSGILSPAAANLIKQTMAIL